MVPALLFRRDRMALNWIAAAAAVALGLVSALPAHAAPAAEKIGVASAADFG